ncbi:hypothetical protein [Leptospira weilii]|uniref:hypothetical protein n=1 Tax=Leptospira weilii TaxID=28184 RepID=UPI0003643C73|nr:hypothetical protein [Leptospira weilii]
MSDHTRIQSDGQGSFFLSFLSFGPHDQTELPAVGNLQENENPMEDSIGTFENGNETLDLKNRSGILRKEI